MTQFADELLQARHDFERVPDEPSAEWLHQLFWSQSLPPSEPKPEPEPEPPPAPSYAFYDGSGREVATGIKALELAASQGIAAHVVGTFGDEPRVDPPLRGLCEGECGTVDSLDLRYRVLFGAYLCAPCYERARRVGWRGRR